MSGSTDVLKEHLATKFAAVALVLLLAACTAPGAEVTGTAVAATDPAESVSPQPTADGVAAMAYTGTWTLTTYEPPPDVPGQECVWSYGGWLCGPGTPAEGQTAYRAGDEVPGSIEIICEAPDRCSATMTRDDEPLWAGSLDVVGDGELRFEEETGAGGCAGQVVLITTRISYTESTARAHHGSVSMPPTCTDDAGVTYSTDQSWSFDGTPG